MKIKVIGIIAIIAIIVFMVACDNGNNPAGGNETLETRNLTIAGTFASQNAGVEEAKFYATAGTGGRSITARSITSTDFMLEGLLEDGDMTFRLRGSYNSETRTYTLSAASSVFIYTIKGSFNDAGTAENASAVVQVKGLGDEWTTIEVAVKVSGTAPVIDGSGTITDYTEGGIPMPMRGIWRDSVNANYYALVNAFSVVVYAKAGGNWVEEETLFFTDISTNTTTGITSGILAFMNWDWDALDIENPEWYNKMEKAFTDQKYPGKTILTWVGAIRNEYVAAMMALPFNERPSWGPSGDPWRDNRWDFGFGSGVNITAVETLLTSLGHRNPETGMWTCGCEWESGGQATQAHRTHLEAILNLPEMSAYKDHIEIVYIDDWNFLGWEGMTQSDLDAFYAAIDAQAAAWAKANGYIVVDGATLGNEMRAINHMENWLWANYPTFRGQFYSRMALRLQGGRLQVGDYVYFTADAIPRRISQVKTFSEVSTLTQLVWQTDSLRR